MKLQRLLSTIGLIFLFHSTLSARALRGTYEVPTNDPQLQGFNTFPIYLKNAGRITRDPSVSIPLPAELLGQTRIYQIHIVQRGPTDIWRGEGIDSMSCETQAVDHRAKYICQIRFTPGSIQIDQKLLESAHQQRGTPVENMSQVFRIANQFADDPIGILRYDL